MKVRLVVTMEAEPGRGADLAAVMAERAKEVMQEPGCEQFEMFRSVTEPDKLVLLELWTDQAALDVHAGVNATRPPLPAGLRKAGGSREDYGYNRVR
jgi:quinol monooxygenase YgiN